MVQRPTQKFGTPIPKDDPHAVSVEYSSWSEFLGLIADDAAVTKNLHYGYPRFTLNPLVLELEKKLLAQSPAGIACSIFPSEKVALRCRQYLQKWSDARVIRIETLRTRLPAQFEAAKAAVVYFEEEFLDIARQYWAIFGEGISSRRAEYLLKFGFEVDPKCNTDPLNPDFGKTAKSTIEKRVAGLTGVNHEDVYLFPTGMAAVFHTHLLFERLTLAIKQEFPAVLYGFAFKDTPKLFKKWGTGLKWYPKGTEQELEELEEFLQTNRISGLMCEAPANPNLRTPNLKRIKAMATKYNFLVAIDDTLGNMVNINVLDYCDVTVTSLTKIFNGACNVMAGSVQISPQSSNRDLLKPAIDELYEDNFWAQDAIELETNSRDVYGRAETVEKNTQAVLSLLQNSEHVSFIHYPSLNETKPNYDLIRTKNGGYGGLFSIVFKDKDNAGKFYDALDVFRGPSLGINSTLCFPYAMGAHKDNLDVPENAGISRYIIRVSIGLEPVEELTQLFTFALKVL